jgi:DNA-directed RNA polymerase subunit E'/Rpb7
MSTQGGFASTATPEDLVNRYSEDKLLEGTVTLLPHQLRANLKFAVQDRLMRMLQSKCSQENGFIIKLRKVISINDGIIETRGANVRFEVK